MPSSCLSCYSFYGVGFVVVYSLFLVSGCRVFVLDSCFVMWCLLSFLVSNYLASEETGEL